MDGGGGAGCLFLDIVWQAIPKQFFLIS